MKSTFEYLKSRMMKPEVQEIIAQAMDRLVCDAAEDFVSTTTQHTAILANITGNPELRWRIFLQKANMKCPSCGNALTSECGRVHCVKCREDLIVRSQVLFNICQKCISYEDKSCPGAMVDSRKFGVPQITSKRTSRVILPGLRSESYD